MNPNLETQNSAPPFKFLFKYFGVAAVTLYCGLIGLTGGIVLCSFMIGAATGSSPTGLSTTFRDILELLGGAVLGGLPIAYIAANWAGAKVGWSKDRK